MTTKTEELGIGAASAPVARRAFHVDPKNYAKQPLTPAEAMSRARQILATPDQLFSTDEGRRIMDALLLGIDSSATFSRALQRGDEVFCLVRQDRCAPTAIRAWADFAGRHGAPIEKVRSAQEIAMRWDNTTIQRKWPD